MALPDGQAKIVSFMQWTADNYPGWDDPHKATKLVGATAAAPKAAMTQPYALPMVLLLYHSHCQ
jgi:hypothetical protein